MQLKFLLLAGLLTLSLARAATFGNYIYTAPPGWTQTRQGDALVFTAPGGGAASIRLTAGAVFQGDLKAWFSEQIARSNAGAKVINQGDVQADQTPDGQTILASAAAVEVGGRTEWRLYIAAQPGDRAELLVYSAASLEAFTKYQAAFTTFADSVDFANVKGVAAGTGSTKPPPAPAPTPAPPPTPTPSTATILPAIPVPNLAQLVRAGLDPENQPIPDEFRCYLSYASSDYSKPAFALQILPNGRYRAPGGEGAYTVVQGSSSSLRYLRWEGGPLSGTDDAFLLFDRTWGQTIQLDGVSDKDLRLYCYQRGGREQHALVQFRRNDPQPGAYPCRTTDGKNTDKGTLEILPGRQYRYGGGSGKYTVNILGKQGDSFSGVDFVGGPLDDNYSTYSEDELGEREFGSVPGRGTRCKMVAKPIVEPRFGTEKAPVPPAGAGGLEGVYAKQTQQFYPNPRLDHDFYLFNKNGYVYTDEPDISLVEADCARTLPSGLPLCEVYTFKNGLITIGNDKPVKFARSGDGYKLDGDDLKPVRPVGALKLAGEYKSVSSFTAVVGTGGGIFENRLNFKKDGTFTRASEGGVSITTTTDGTAFGDTTGGVYSSSSRSNGGTYAFAGNTLTLTYGDGRVEKRFVYLPELTKQGQPDLEWLYIGGSNYFLEEPKK